MLRTGLVLQGGGALGAFECGAIRALYEVGHIHPDVISGVSIGAFNAACLVGSKGDEPIKTLETLWDRLAVDWLPCTFGSPQFGAFQTEWLNPDNWAGVFSNKPIHCLLTELIDIDKLNSGTPKLILHAVDIHTGEKKVFRNFGPHRQRLEIEHILASGSVPLWLPPTHVDGCSYWDGGLFDNTPLDEVLRELQRMQAEEKRVYLIELFPRRNMPPRTLWQAYDRLMELRYCRKMELQHELIATRNKQLALQHGHQRIGRLLPLSSEHFHGEGGDWKYQPIESISIHTPVDTEDVTGPYDFSLPIVIRRRNQGFDAARNSIQTHHPAQQKQIAGEAETMLATDPDLILLRQIEAAIQTRKKCGEGAVRMNARNPEIGMPAPRRTDR